MKYHFRAKSVWKKAAAFALLFALVMSAAATGAEKALAAGDTVGIHDIFEAKDDSKLERFKARVLNGLLYHDAAIDVSDIGITADEIRYTLGDTEVTGVYAARQIVRHNAFHSTASTTGFPTFTYQENGAVATVSYTYHPAWTTDLVRQAIAGYDDAMERINPDDGDFAKILKLHDWIVKNVSYGMSKLYPDFALGALANRSAVCAGYAQCYGFLLEQAGVESIYVAADTPQEPHAWNLVKLDGHWFHVDCTWDRGLGANPNVNHTYFMLNDEEFNANGAHGDDWKDPAKGYPTGNLCSIENKFYADNRDMATDSQIAENPIVIRHEFDASTSYETSAQEHWRTCAAGVQVRGAHTGDPCTVCGYASEKPITITFDPQNGEPTFAQTIAAGEKAQAPQTPSRSDYEFAGWYTAPEGGERVDFSEKTFGANITLYAQWTQNGATYACVSGADAEWVKDSGAKLTLVVKRSRDDETCFAHFTGVRIDGDPLSAGTDYDATAGSAIVTLKPAALQKLAEGKHVVRIVFDDGETETTLNVKAAENLKQDLPPKTNDAARAGLNIAVAFTALVGAGCALAVWKKRGEQ